MLNKQPSYFCFIKFYAVLQLFEANSGLFKMFIGFRDHYE